MLIMCWMWFVNAYVLSLIQTVIYFDILMLKVIKYQSKIIAYNP